MALTPAQLVERALQKCLLDSCGDGWTLSGYVVVMGLERVADGDIESASWVYTAPNQPGWVTSGLLIETDGMFDRTAGED